MKGVDVQLTYLCRWCGEPVTRVFYRTEKEGTYAGGSWFHSDGTRTACRAKTIACAVTVAAPTTWEVAE